MTYFIDVLEITLPLSLFIMMLYASLPLLKRAFVVKWRYFMWLFVAVRLLIPMHFAPSQPTVTLNVPWVGESPLAGEYAIGTMSKSAINVQQIMFMIWAAGALLFVLRQITGYARFKRKIKRWARPVGNKSVTECLYTAAYAVGLRSVPNICVCPAVETPMLFGLFRPVLLLPGEDYDRSELGFILRHELVHYRRRDILYKLILTAANAVHWFNPAVYLMVSAANRDIELACDDEAVKGEDMECRRRYCRAILNAIRSKRQRSVTLSTCFVINKNIVLERFKEVLELRKKKNGIILFAAVALSVAISGGTVDFAAAKVSDELEEEHNILERPTQEADYKSETPTVEPPETAAPQSTPNSSATPTPTDVPNVAESAAEQADDAIDKPEVYVFENGYEAEPETYDEPAAESEKTPPTIVVQTTPTPELTPEPTPERSDEIRDFGTDTRSIRKSALVVPKQSMSIAFQSGTHTVALYANEDTTVYICHSADVGDYRVFDVTTGEEVVCEYTENKAVCHLNTEQLAVLEVTADVDENDVYIYAQ